MDPSESTPPTRGDRAHTVSGRSVLIVGAVLVVGVALTAWLLRPDLPGRRGEARRSPTWTIGTSGEASQKVPAN